MESDATERFKFKHHQSKLIIMKALSKITNTFHTDTEDFDNLKS